jgi:hypothetical protein
MIDQKIILIPQFNHHQLKAEGFSKKRKGLGALFISAPKPINVICYAIDINLFLFNNRDVVNIESSCDSSGKIR